MANEHGDLREPAAETDDFPLTELPQAGHLLIPLPPERPRLQILEVLLSNAPWEPSILRCKRLESIECFKISAQQPSTNEEEMRLTTFSRDT